MNKIIFLSHNPHEVHLDFAESVGAEIKKMPFLDSWVNLTKRFRPFVLLQIPISFLYAIFMAPKDIIISDGGSCLWVAAFLKLKNKKTKLIYLDADLMFYKADKRNKIVNLFIRRAAKKIDGIISVSEQNKKYISLYSGAPVKVVPPYLKNMKKSGLKRKNYGLYVGRLDPDKNIKRVIEFAEQCPFVEKLLIVGDGVQKNFVEAEARRTGKIIYAGARDDVGKFYDQCKFLIHIPDADPHPCTTIEAAACGCFPIISEESGTSYLFDDIFLIENPDDFKEINKRIETILDNEKKYSKILAESMKNYPKKEKLLNKFKESFGELIKI